ncbi:MAG TPA: hypothetical protein VIF81_10990 [Pyrinomonadaceae bacterium]
MASTRLNKNSALLGFFEKKTTKIAVLSLLCFVVVMVLFVAWQKWTNPAQPPDYEGRIVDRWADNSGAAEGYQPRLALVIESTDGRRFTVRVDPNVYESARVGMRIRSRSGQVVLIDSEKNPVAK